MKERQRNKQGMRSGRRPLNAVVRSTTGVKVPLHSLVNFFEGQTHPAVWTTEAVAASLSATSVLRDRSMYRVSVEVH